MTTRLPWLSIVAVAGLAVALMVACSDSTSPSVTPTVLPSATASPAPSATAAPSATPTSAPPAPTATPVPSPTAAPDVRPLGASFEIRVAQTVRLEATGWRLTFTGITQDSRCPVDVTCIWAGEVTAAFAASGPGGVDLPLEVTLGPRTNPQAGFGGLFLTLENVRPRPSSSQPVAAADYVATVLVSR